MTELREKDKTGLQRSSHEVIYFPEDPDQRAANAEAELRNLSTLAACWIQGLSVYPNYGITTVLSSPSQSKR